MRYLLGDSTESNLDFNYLTFLREVVDVAVVLLEAEATLAGNLEKRNVRASEWAGLIRAVEELGNDATGVVEPIMTEQPKTPAGRCAAAIAKAIREAVGGEVAAAKTSSAAARDEIDRDDQQIRARARTVLEKLLCAHDLPEAEKTLEATWTSGGIKARAQQRTGFGLEAVLQLEPAASAVLVPDLRVDRMVDNVEVHVHEAGGWLKKGEKLVAQKLGRYQVVAIRSTKTQIELQLRSAADANALTLTIVAARTGAITIEGNAAGKEYAIEDRNRGAIKQLADKLEAALRELEHQRTALIELTIDSKSFSIHPHPRTLAERLIGAIAPTVQTIARHSRSPGELVLRRQLADDRREEVFIPIGDLMKRIETLPETARDIFSPLQLTGAVTAPATDAPPVVRAPVLPVASGPAARGSTTSIPRDRDAPRTLPPSAPPARSPDLVVVDDAKIAASIDAALDDGTDVERGAD